MATLFTFSGGEDERRFEAPPPPSAVEYQRLLEARTCRGIAGAEHEEVMYARRVGNTDTCPLCLAIRVAGESYDRLSRDVPIIDRLRRDAEVLRDLVRKQQQLLVLFQEEYQRATGCYVTRESLTDRLIELEDER